MWWHSQQMCSFLAPPSCNFYIICHKFNFSFHLPKCFPKPPAFNTLALPAPTPLASCRTLCDPCVCNALRARVVAAVLARCGVGCCVQTYSYLSFLFSFAPPTTFGTLARSLKFRNRLRVCGCCTVCGARCSCVGCHCVSRSARHLNSTPCSSHYLMSYLLSPTSPLAPLSPSPHLPHPSSLVSSQTIIEALKFITTGNHPAGGNGAAFVHDPKVRHVHKKLCLSEEIITGEAFPPSSSFLSAYFLPFVYFNLGLLLCQSIQVLNEREVKARVSRSSCYCASPLLA